MQRLQQRKYFSCNCEGFCQRDSIPHRHSYGEAFAQCAIGFLRNRSATNMIFPLRQMQKCYKQ